MGARYRVQQFVWAISGPNAAPDLGELSNLLTEEQTRLFRTLAVVDQRHCLAVARALAQRSETDAGLLQAALMHDIGKSLAHIAVWERVAYVLLSRVSARLVCRIASARRGDVGHGLYLLAHHAELGAQVAAQAGFSEDVVALVRGSGDARRQTALREADDTH
jgi:putative nucleotidyltransferase with HDIG domain